MSAAIKSPRRGPDSPITVSRATGTVRVSAGRILQAARQALGDRHVTALSIAIVDDAIMAGLHERFMGDARATDVLTFDLRDDPRSNEIEGEIVVSAETARREAVRRRLEPDAELLRYVIHGVLHLLAMDDRTAAGRRRMRRAETRTLNGLPKRALRATRPRARVSARKHR